MLGSLSLIHGVLPVTIVVLAVGSLALLLGRSGGLWKRQLLIGIPVTAAIVGIVALLVDGLALIAYQFPNSYYLWFGLIILGLAFTVIGWGRFGLGRRMTSGLSLVLTTLMALMLVNGQYQYYPTVTSLFGVDAHRMSQSDLNLDALQARAAQQAQSAAARQALEQARIQATGGDAQAPVRGTTVQIPIPGKASGFAARDAYVWLPPIWFTDPTLQLPVVELLAGVPGGPADWIRGGNADQTASRFAQAHGGRAPILVMPDATGGELVDTECVDSPRGNAETYLSVDVPDFMRATFHASTGPMAIAGLSAGGTCATMLALRHPALYTTFGDYAGLTSPTVAEWVDPRDTTRDLFGGSTEAYLAHDPLHLLATNTYPGLAGWFEVGSADGGPLAAQRTLVPLARHADIATTAIEVPGADHDFDLFGRAFADSLPFFSYRLGLTELPPTGGSTT